MSKAIGMGVRKGTVVLFVPTLFGCFLGIYVCSFFKVFFVTCFSFFWGGGGGDIELAIQVIGSDDS